MNQELPNKESVQILTQTILPFALHGVNPRTIMGETEWNKVKHQVQRDSMHECMCCGRYIRHVTGDWIETHEVYDFNVDKKEAKLIGFVGLCNECHNFIHQGRLRILVMQGRMSIEEYHRVICHGMALLQQFGLVKQNLPIHEIENPNWYLLFNGNKYQKL